MVYQPFCYRNANRQLRMTCHIKCRFDGPYASLTPKEEDDAFKLNVYEMLQYDQGSF